MKRQIKIKKNLYKKIEARLKKSKDFQSVEEYVNFFLENLLVEQKKQAQEKLIKQRLKDLGYH